MENHIILEPAKKIREIARNALAGYWKPVMLGMLIYYLLTDGIGMLLDYFFSYSYEMPGQFAANFTQSVPYGYQLYDLIIGGPIAFGLAMFLLAFFRSKKTDNTMLFEGFSFFGKTFVLQLLIYLKIFLWSLLFIIPGIIAGFRYSQAFYVMVDHPEYSPSKCIEESKRLMAGNKGRYFYLFLTFIGWAILASAPAAIYGELSNDSISNIILSLVLGLPQVALLAYVQVSLTVFYELADQRLVVVDGIDPENVVNTSYTVEENRNEENKEEINEENKEEIIKEDKKEIDEEKNDKADDVDE